jgi:hypothetical protein
VARHLAWLRTHQLLAWVERGTTPALSPGVLQCGPNGHKPGNIATVYMLCAPTRVRLVAVSRPEDHGYEHVHAGPAAAVEAAAGPPPDPPADSTHGGQDTPPASESVDTVTPPSPRRRKETPYARETFAKRSRATPALKNLQPRCVQCPQTMHRMYLRGNQSTPAGGKNDWPRLRPSNRRCRFWEGSPLRTWHTCAGSSSGRMDTTPTSWLPWARPDGTNWHHEHAVRHVPGWFRHRLAPWHVDPTDPTSPWPPPRGRTQAEATVPGPWNVPPARRPGC